jgi:hypothetical protein
MENLIQTLEARILVLEQEAAAEVNAVVAAVKTTLAKELAAIVAELKKLEGGL